jgi:hypothetical protein
MEKRQAIRIDVLLQGGLMHEAAEGEVRQQEPVAFLAHQIGRFAPQHHLRPAQVRLQFVERRLSGKGLARYTETRPVSSPSP